MDGVLPVEGASGQRLTVCFADHSVVSLAHADYAAIDTQITTDSSVKIDCEIVRKAAGEEAFAIAQLPALRA